MIGIDDSFNYVVLWSNTKILFGVNNSSGHKRKFRTALVAVYVFLVRV